MMHTDEDRRDHDIDVSDRSNPNTHYDRDRCDPDPEYVDGDLAEWVDLIGSQRRRITIRRLGEIDQEADGHATVGHEDLAREIGAIEDDVDVAIVNWRTIRSAKTGLRANHLPLLDETGLIDWNEDERTVTTTAQTAAYAQLLESTAGILNGDGCNGDA